MRRQQTVRTIVGVIAPLCAYGLAVSNQQPAHADPAPPGVPRTMPGSYAPPPQPGVPSAEPGIPSAPPGDPSALPSGPSPVGQPSVPASQFKPGAPGAGDPYFPKAGNGGYDAQHYQLDLAYTPKGKRLDATATIAAKATQDLSRFDLDLRGLTVTGVSVNGAPAVFTHTGQELTITPRAGLPTGQVFTVAVRYGGVPGPVKNGPLGTYGWVPTKDGAVVASQPDGASTWYPVNDTPADKATYDFKITVPKGLQAIANGVRRGPAGPVTKWHEDRPMASYLVTLAIGKFTVREGKTPGGIPILTAVDPTIIKNSPLYGLTADATDWEVKTFGRYPFASTGGIVDDPDLGYALETETRPVYAGFEPDNSIIVHELAHQWYGDSVTLTKWKDIWLNEGFATYAEWLWDEQHGEWSAQRHFDEHYKQSASAPVFATEVGDPGVKGMFGSAVYERGAMTLHALRKKIGDKVFFRLLRAWAAAHQGGNATTSQFVALAEKLSGRDLSAFFHTWLYTTTKPKSW